MFFLSRQEHLEKIKQADYFYYEKNQSILSDAEYDDLRQDYIQKYGAEDLNYVAGNVTKTFLPFKHVAPVSSLSKVKAGDDKKIREAVEKLFPVVLEPKLDGLTVVAYPIDDKGRCQFVTRGNGREGEILPNFISRYENKSVNRTGYPIRGEVFLTRQSFEEIISMQIERGEETFKQIRNAASGILRNKERSPFIDKLSFLCYDLLNFDAPESEKIDKIKNESDFDVVEIRKFSTVDETIGGIENFYNDVLQTSQFPIDGIVMKTDIENSLKKFGMTDHHPNNAVAWKPETEKFVTKLEKILWQVGRQRITPVAVVSPIEIDGTIVSQASLANVGIIKKYDLRLGATVQIHKSNEIIPQVLGVIENGEQEILIPKVCPSCKKNLREENEQLFCDNPFCFEKMAQNMAYLGSKKLLDIQGLSIETTRKILEKFKEKIDRLKEYLLFDLSEEDFLKLDGFAKKSAKNLYQAIQNSRQNVDLAHFVAACLQPKIGLNIGELLMKKFHTYEKLKFALKNPDEDFCEIKGIGEIGNQILHSENFCQAYELLREFITPTDYAIEGESQKSLTFVLTGKMEKPRKFYEEKIQKAGHKTASRVSNLTDFLVIADKNSTSAKTKAAQQFGTKLLTPEELENFLESVEEK